MSRPSLIGRLRGGERIGLLAVLWTVDLGFVLWAQVQLETRAFRESVVGYDGSPGEWFQYLKQAAVFGLLLREAARRHAPLHGFWALIFLYLLLDDSLRLHEQLGGGWIGGWLDAGWMTGQGYHYGQLVYAFLVGVPVLVVLTILYSKASDAGRSLTHVMLPTLALVVFFAVVIDFATSQISGAPLAVWLNLIEEAGEHAAVSLAVWIAAVESRSARGTT